MIGYPDSPYVWGMYDKFKSASESYILADIIYNSTQYLMHNGAVLKNELFNLSQDRNNFPIYVDLREYQLYKHTHRGGWYIACENLYKLSSKNDNDEYNRVIYDMYIDRTFHWTRSYMFYRGIIPYTSPWCGFIHHTINAIYSEYNTISLFLIPEFIQSLYMCKSLFTLSEPLSCYIREKLKSLDIYVPVITFAHPIVDPLLYFDFEKFHNNNKRKLINIGAWMRNPFTIYKIQPINYLQKAILIGKSMKDHIQPFGFSISLGNINEINQDNNNNTQNNIFRSPLHPCRSELSIILR